MQILVRSLKVGTLTATAALVIGIGVLSGGPASAEACSAFNCGQEATNSTSSRYVRVADNFGTTKPPASANIVSVYPGGRTSSATDWDAFEVPAGYCATYVFGDYRKGKTINKVDNRSRSTSWVKFDGISSTVNVELDKTCTWNKAG